MNFASLYQTFFKPVFAYILCRVGQRALAEDLAACTWRKAYEKIALFDPQKGTFRQWIFTIARNEINMYYRLYYVRKFLSLTGFEDNAFGVSSQEDASREEDTQALLNAMAVLSQKEKDLVALKFYSGMNNREIARQTGLSESNVGTILHRSIAKLRKEMTV